MQPLEAKTHVLAYDLGHHIQEREKNHKKSTSSSWVNSKIRPTISASWCGSTSCIM